MKSKRTIRKLTPVTRKLAHLTIATRSVQRRLDNLTEEVWAMEKQARADRKWIENSTPQPSRENVQAWFASHSEGEEGDPS